MSADPVWTQCCDKVCGVRFALPEHVHAQTQSVGAERWVWCPNGHRQYWTQTNEDRLTRRVQVLEDDLATVRGQRDAAFKTASYWKGIAHRRAK